MDIITFPENLLTTSGLSILCMALFYSETRCHIINWMFFFYFMLCEISTYLKSDNFTTEKMLYFQL